MSGLIDLVAHASGFGAAGHVPLAVTTEAATFASGAVLMLAGLYLRLRLPHDRMMTEERMKDGRMTERDARRRLLILRFSGPVAVLLGLALFAELFLG